MICMELGSMHLPRACRCSRCPSAHHMHQHQDILHPARSRKSAKCLPLVFTGLDEELKTSLVNTEVSIGADFCELWNETF